MTKFFGVAFMTGVTLLLVGALCGCTVEKPGNAKAEELYLNAVSHYANRALDEAARELREALAEDAHFFQAELLLGKVFFFQGREEAALEIFAALHKKMPRYTEARFWHIRCLILAGQYDDAQKLLDAEAAFNPGDWRAFITTAPK